MVIKKISEAESGIFYVKEYLVEDGLDPVGLIRQLQAGPGDVQEVITYVFSDRDPLGMDTRSFTPEEFFEIVPRMEVYGPELAFDVIVRTEGHPVTAELTHGENVIFINTLDRGAELEELLGPEHSEGDTEGKITDKAGICSGISGLGDKIECIMSLCNACHFSDDPAGREKSAAESSWKSAIISVLLSESGNFEKYDMDRVIRMCLIHGLSEMFTEEKPASGTACADGKKAAGFSGADSLHLQERKTAGSACIPLQENETAGPDSMPLQEREISGRENDMPTSKLETWLGTLEPGLTGRFMELLEEMKEGKTPEAELFAEIVRKT